MKYLSLLLLSVLFIPIVQVAHAQNIVEEIGQAFNNLTSGMMGGNETSGNASSAGSGNETSSSGNASSAGSGNQTSGNASSAGSGNQTSGNASSAGSGNETSQM